jgi:hypothetical protein
MARKGLLVALSVFIDPAHSLLKMLMSLTLMEVRETPVRTIGLLRVLVSCLAP